MEGCPLGTRWTCACWLAWNEGGRLREFDSKGKVVDAFATLVVDKLNVVGWSGERRREGGRKGRREGSGEEG